MHAGDKILVILVLGPQSAVRKRMAAVHFTTIPFEPNTANYTWILFFFVGGGGGGKFVPVIAKLPILGLRFINFSVRFYEQFYCFHALRTVSKCTSRHLFSYGGLCIKIWVHVCTIVRHRRHSLGSRGFQLNFFVKVGAGAKEMED